MTLPERILHAVTESNIAYLPFSLGLMDVLFEFLSPGLLIPGVAGAICPVERDGAGQERLEHSPH